MNYVKKWSIIMVSLIGFLTGCTAPDVSVYEGETPKLNIREYLNGEVDAWGIIEDYSGEVVSRFHVKMHGKWNGDKGTLTEDFTYSDGTTQHREWQLTMVSDNEFTGTAPDVIGEMRGKSAGNATAMQYVLEVPVKGRTWRFTFDDRLYLLNDTYLINRAKMKKFGFTAAELTLFFKKK